MYINLRDDLRRETQTAYGGYCSYTRAKGDSPVSYTRFKFFHEKGMRTKDIYNFIHVEKKNEEELT